MVQVPDVSIKVSLYMPSKVRVGCPKDKVRVGPWSNITKLSKVRVGCMRKIQELAKLELTISDLTLQS